MRESTRVTTLLDKENCLGGMRLVAGLQIGRRWDDGFLG